MYEYLFFDDDLKYKFTQKLTELHTDYKESIDNDNLCIGIDENLDEKIVDKIDDFYDILLDEQADITIAEEPESINTVGIQFTTSTGELSQAKLDPKLVNRLLEILTYQELQGLVQTIASATENPAVNPLCQKDKP